MQPTCLIGAVPSEPQPLIFGSTEKLCQRWSRWLDLSRAEFVDADPVESRTWRFLCRPGIFEYACVAGVWRLSRTRGGERRPLALLTSGQVPAVGDPWFDAVSSFLEEAVEGLAPPSLLRRRMARLPPFAPTEPPDAAALFWIDDWEVHELRFATIQDLAADGFARMLAPRPVEEA